MFTIIDYLAVAGLAFCLMVMFTPEIVLDGLLDLLDMIRAFSFFFF